MNTTDPTLQRAIQYLASVCDGAVTEDGQGFNGTDTNFGKWLAAQAEWTPEQAAAAYDMARTYRGQLSGVGIDFDAIEAPAEIQAARELAQSQRAEANRRARAAESKRLRIEGAEFVLNFDYDADMVAAVRDIPRRSYSGRDKSNRAPVTPASAAAIRAFIERFGPFTVDSSAQAELDRLAGQAVAVEAGAPARNRIEFEDGKAIAHFEYSRERVQAAKAAGGKFNGSDKTWRFVLNSGNATKFSEFLSELPNVQVDPALRERLDALMAEAEHRLEASRAEDSSLVIKGLGAELRPFQRAGVEYALRTRRTFIGDDMGTGKTVQALAALKVEDAFPAVVVAPNAVKLTWTEHVQGPLPYAPTGWLPGKRAVALYGQKPDPEQLRGADVVVVNWDMLSYWLELLVALRPKALILDECHMAKNSKAKRTKAALKLAKVVRRRGDGMVLNLSGTPLLNRPIELASQLDILGRLDDFGGFFGFAKRYTGAYRDTYGWDFSGATNLEELSERLRSTCFIRRTKDQVLPELPPKQIAHQHVELDNRREYLAVENDVIAYLREQVTREAEFDEELADLPEEERKQRIRQRASDAAYKAEQAQHLVQINALRRVIAKGKLNASIEWIKNFLDSTEEKLVVMAYHVDEMQKPLLAALGEYNPAVIAGGVGAEVQKANERKFQTDPTCRVIVCSLRAAGVGITLTAASNTAMLELDWTPTVLEQAEDRTHRIGAEGHESVTCWYLLGKLPRSEEPTIDDDMRALLSAKLAVTSTVTDGTARQVEVSILREVTERMLARADARQEALL